MMIFNNYCSWLSKPEKIAILFVLFLSTAALAYIGSPHDHQAPSPNPQPKHRSRFSDIVATVLIILGIIFFTVVFILIDQYIKGNLHFHGSAANNNNVGPGARQRAEAMVERFRRVTHREIKMQLGSGREEADECTICLEVFADDEVVNIIPNCGHVFHPHCILDWLSNGSIYNCPNCKRDLQQPPSFPSSSTGSSVVDPRFGEGTSRSRGLE
uniref:RING-type E3 ubiquitin transferase n=1 Tax=Cannabis sativa TaxID=3483 RepID=A0A803PNP2_CANSA